MSLKQQLEQRLTKSERELHAKLLETNTEYRVAVQTMKARNTMFMLHDLLRQSVQKGADPAVLSTGIDLEDAATRLNVFATQPGAYLDSEIVRPPTLDRFLLETDGRFTTDREMELIEQSVLKWLYAHYNPPSHIGFRLDFSDILASAGHPAPLEIWIACATFCPTRPA